MAFKPHKNKMKCEVVGAGLTRCICRSKHGFYNWDWHTTILEAWSEVYEHLISCMCGLQLKMEIRSIFHVYVGWWICLAKRKVELDD